MTGLELSFLKSWQAWDEVDVGCLQFGGVEFRVDAGLPCEVLALSNTEGVVFILDISSSTIQVCGPDGDSVFESSVELKLKA